VVQEHVPFQNTHSGLYPTCSILTEEVRWVHACHTDHVQWEEIQQCRAQNLWQDIYVTITCFIYDMIWYNVEVKVTWLRYVLGLNTVFTWMQDNLIEDDPQIKYLLRKSILPLISYSYCAHVGFCLPLPISITVSSFTVSAFIFFTLLPLPSLSLSFHSISSVLSIAFDVQHFRWDVLPCHYDPYLLNNTFIFIRL